MDDRIHFGDLVVRISGEEHIDLSVEDAGCYFKITKPNSDDIDALPIFTITSDEPWDPNNVGENKGQIGEVPPRLAAAGMGRKEETTDPHVLCPFLGHASDEVIQKTLQAMMRMSQGDFCIPMRRQRKAPFPQLGV